MCDDQKSIVQFVLRVHFVLFFSLEDPASLRVFGGINYPILINGIIVLAQIIYALQHVSAEHLCQDWIIFFLIDHIAGLVHLLLLKSLVLCLFSFFDKLRHTGDDLMKVPCNTPLFTIQNFCVKIFAIVQVNDMGESSLTEYLRLIEGIFFIKEDLEHKMLVKYSFFQTIIQIDLTFPDIQRILWIKWFLLLLFILFLVFKVTRLLFLFDLLIFVCWSV